MRFSRVGRAGEVGKKRHFGMFLAYPPPNQYIPFGFLSCTVVFRTREIIFLLFFIIIPLFLGIILFFFAPVRFFPETIPFFFLIKQRCFIPIPCRIAPVPRLFGIIPRCSAPVLLSLASIPLFPGTDRFRKVPDRRGRAAIPARKDLTRICWHRHIGKF